MTYLEARDFAQRIRRERPDILPRVSGYADSWGVVVKKVNRKQGVLGGPLFLSQPVHLNSEDDWIRVRSSL